MAEDRKRCVVTRMAAGKEFAAAALQAQIVTRITGASMARSR
jgi:hypothetical protein